MARLPQPGSDDGIWGAVLNDYLLQAHDSSGFLKSASVSSSTLSPASGANNQVLTYDTTKPGNLKWATPATTVAVTMGGALSGPSSNAAINDNAVTEPKLAISNSPTAGQVLGWNGTGLAWQPVAAAPVSSVNAKTGAVVINKSDVGLSNVNNTSDANKPISTATQAAIAASAQRASNLSDLTNAAAARANLGLGSAATTNTTAYATAAQGAAADTAVQPADLGTPVLALPSGEAVPAGTAPGTVIVRYLA